MSRRSPSEALRRFTRQAHLGTLACLIHVCDVAAQPADASSAAPPPLSSTGSVLEVDPSPNDATTENTLDGNDHDGMGDVEPTPRESDPTTAACIRKHAEGQEARMEQRLLDAALDFGQCAVRACPQLVREDCSQWQTQVFASAPRVVFQTPRGDLAGLQIWINGQLATLTFGEPMIFDPGRHDLRFDAPGRVPVTRQLHLRAGSAPTIVEMELPRPEPARPTLRAAQRDSSPTLPARPAAPPSESLTPSLVYVFGGVATAALGVGTYFAIDAARDRSNAIDTCAPLCETRDVESIERKFLIADVALGVSLVSAATALAFYVLDSERDTQRTARPSVAVSLASNDLSVEFGGNF